MKRDTSRFQLFSPLPVLLRGLILCISVPYHLSNPEYRLFDVKRFWGRFITSLPKGSPGNAPPRTGKNPGSSSSLLEKVLVALGLFGAIFNVFAPFLSYMIWLPANIGFAWLNYRRAAYPQSALFLAYTLTSTLGIITHYMRYR